MTGSEQGPLAAQAAGLRDSVRRRLAPARARLLTDARTLSALPEARARLRAAAEQADRGMLVLPGTGGAPRFVGAPPDWYTDPVGDAEYVWGLNRMPHWRALLGERAVSGEARWAVRVVSELRDWLERCPPIVIPEREQDRFGLLHGAHPWRLLEVGIRLFDAWQSAMTLLVDDDLLDDATFGRWVESISAHAETILIGTPLLWPGEAHNHALMESLGLLCAAYLAAELPRSDVWKQTAQQRLENCARAQITQEGGQIEGCPSYHNGCVHWFVQAALMGRELGIAWSEDFSMRVANAQRYSEHCVRPTGETVPWGDSDPDRTGIKAALWHWLLERNDATLSRTIRLVGAEAALVDCEHFLFHLPVFTETRAAVTRASKLEPPTVERTLWARELKQVALRSDWSPEAASVFFACRSPVNNGHAHIDPMGFDFTALGRALVTDPGRYTYRVHPDRFEFKSSQVHATVTIDDQQPFEANGSWFFTPQPPGDVLGVVEHDDWSAAWATLEWPTKGHHRRLIVLFRGSLLVVDHLLGFASEHRAQIWLPIDDPNVSWDPAARRATTERTDPGLVVAASAEAGSGSVLAGRISTCIDVAHPSSRLKLETALGDSVAWALALVPFRGTPPAVAVPSCRIAAGDVVCEFAIEGKRWVVTWNGTDAPRLEPPDR